MKVMLIDDHAMFREGVALLLIPLVQPLETWEAGSCEEAFAMLERRGAPDMVLIDLALPGMSGLEGIRYLHANFPSVAVVALSSSDDRDTVLGALDAGAMGFIPKSSTSSILVGALRLIMAKGIYLPSSVFLSGRASPPKVADRGMHPSELGLTQRQGEVLYQILQGKSAKLIGRELSLSASTVKAHTSAVLRALKVTTRTQAIVVAGRLSLYFDNAPSGG